MVAPHAVMEDLDSYEHALTHEVEESAYGNRSCYVRESKDTFGAILPDSIYSTPRTAWRNTIGIADETKMRISSSQRWMTTANMADAAPSSTTTANKKEPRRPTQQQVAAATTRLARSCRAATSSSTRASWPEAPVFDDKNPDKSGEIRPKYADGDEANRNVARCLDFDAQSDCESKPLGCVAHERRRHA